MSIQETEFGEETKKFKSIIMDKEKELAELKRIVTSKDTQINELKENFLNEKMEIKKEVCKKLLGSLIKHACFLDAEGNRK